MSKSKPETLDLKFPIFETHCHLDYLKRYSLDELLKECRSSNIQKFLTISVEAENLDKVVKISELHDFIYCSQGIHPHHAIEYSDIVEQKILKNIKRDRTIAIGEIGLDYHYDRSPRDIQKNVLERQLNLAIENELPIIIHTREADTDMISILKNFESKLKNVVLHSYTSGQELAEYALSQNYYLGFNGIITFKKAEDVVKRLKITPIDQMVLETDAPFLSPAPHRGKENGPQYLPFIAQKIMEVKNITAEELLPQVWNNSLRLFKLS